MLKKNQTTKSVCPSCGEPGMSIFYEVTGVPVHSVLLHTQRQEALEYPTGDIRLGYCQSCGFVSNLAFDPSLHEYSAKYESTQGYSSTFNAFHRRLAQNLIDRYSLRGKRIIEIGCGQGDFLTLLCEMGNNQGVGFDPAYVAERSLGPANSNVSFVADFYSEKYTDTPGDFVCCKMTLEHIHHTAEFAATVRRATGDDPNKVVFFQVPNARYVFKDVAFWDIYYEHCSYFTLGSIARLFRKAGFDVLELWTDYDDQYLMISAHPGSGQGSAYLPQEDDLVDFAQEITHFIQAFSQKRIAWQEKIAGLNAAGKKIVLWGGGSKAVAFLTTLGIHPEQIAYAVDINPHKAGTFLAGTGQKVVAPSTLLEYRPDVVIVMNPIYCAEIGENLKQMGLAPTLLSVEDI